MIYITMKQPVLLLAKTILTTIISKSRTIFGDSTGIQGYTDFNCRVMADMARLKGGI